MADIRQGETGGGCALASNPKLLLLDEPLEGVARVRVDDAHAARRRIAREEKMWDGASGRACMAAPPPTSQSSSNAEQADRRGARAARIAGTTSA